MPVKLQVLSPDGPSEYAAGDPEDDEPKHP